MRKSKILYKMYALKKKKRMLSASRNLQFYNENQIFLFTCIFLNIEEIMEMYWWKNIFISYHNKLFVLFLITIIYKLYVESINCWRNPANTFLCSKYTFLFGYTNNGYGTFWNVTFNRLNIRKKIKILFLNLITICF